MFVCRINVNICIKNSQPQYVSRCLNFAKLFRDLEANKKIISIHVNECMTNKAYSIYEILSILACGW